jgi:aspartate racemase
VKLLGMVGGTTWFSTAEYYANLNKTINDRLGGANSAECALVSINFADLVRNNEARDFDANRQMFLRACKRLCEAGAHGIVLCANTAHMYADEIEKRTGLPVIHIAVATGKDIASRGLRKVALLGTKPTMEMDFYKDKLAEAGISCIIPNEADRIFIHKSIFDELGRGIFSDEMRKRYVEIISGLADAGAEGAILGCTEIPLLISPEDVAIPTFDTMRLHVQAAVDFMLS